MATTDAETRVSMTWPLAGVGILACVAMLAMVCPFSDLSMRACMRRGAHAGVAMALHLGAMALGLWLGSLAIGRNGRRESVAYGLGIACWIALSTLLWWLGFSWRDDE